MNSFLVCDITGNKWSEVEQAMKNFGYWDRWIRGGANATNSEIYHLPERCLWKPNVELKTAKAELEAVIQNLNASLADPDKISLLRCVVLSVDPWDAIPGIPKSIL